jgi:hypothetical protein
MDQAPKQQSKKHPKSYTETMKGDRKIYKEDYRDTLPLRRFIFQNHQPIDRPREEEECIRVPPFRRFSTPRYQTIFYGLCYACNNFGHKAANCRANNRNIKKENNHMVKDEKALTGVWRRALLMNSVFYHLSFFQTDWIWDHELLS